MTVIPGHFELTPEQRRFKTMLDGFPALHPFWDWNTRECDIRGLERYIRVCSHAERIMASFFATVWLRDNAFPFSVVEAVQVLDAAHRQVITEWLADPYLP